MKIANIDLDKRTLIIAELSANHLHKFELAKKTIKAAKDAGADAIKLQTYTPDTLTIDSDNEFFMIKGGLWNGRNLYDLYKEAYTPWKWQPKLMEYAKSLGLLFFSTPFDKTAVDFLEKLDVPAYKIASFEIVDIPLVEYVASKGKPILVSTGVAELEDIELFLKTCKKAGNDKIAILKCTSAYPAPLDEMNLLTIPDMAKRFNCIVGLSDHSAEISVPIAAVALGAKIIEAHIILNRDLGGPDAPFSLEPDEFRLMVEKIREVEKALGKVTYDLSEKVKKNKVFSRSIFSVDNMKAGEIFTEKNIRSIRPGNGLHPKHYKEVLGKKATKDIKRGMPLKFSLIEGYEHD